ncbi:hypothetical protein SKAU_G00405160 [Synaphobranchus kaupii]|uniref:Phosphatidylinositol-specific phospholipase C X domain-containing protein n=1 Tax=Synaphobranchus kaupii TaxID=118154 RepID=A0A9Q1ICS8_SYNKA|nr:hypothetical protein SKAU_G00405160 [Synaphobranchus kaupii]
MEFPLHLLLLTLLFAIPCEGGYFNDDGKLRHVLLKVDWMSAIPDEKPLSAVTIPGTHESLTLYGGPLIQRQVWSLSTQLEAGLRYFDMEVQENVFTANIEVRDGAIIHEKFKDVLSTLRSFLVGHRSETVLLRVKTESRKMTEHLKKLMNGDNDVWLELSVPTMAEVRGKIVFMESENVKLGVLNTDTYIKGDETFKCIEKKMEMIIKHLNQGKDICANNLVLTATNGRRYLGIIKKTRELGEVKGSLEMEELEEISQLEWWEKKEKMAGKQGRVEKVVRMEMEGKVVRVEMEGKQGRVEMEGNQGRVEKVVRLEMEEKVMRVEMEGKVQRV